MIFIDVTLIAGRTAEQKANMFREMTQATARALNVPLDAVRIAIDEVAPAHFAVAGVVKSGPSGGAQDAPAT
jgi:4-oxalocrotonate tautomerase